MSRTEPMEELSEIACWRLLRQHQLGVGRIGFDDGEPDHDGGWAQRPVILPVNYIVDVHRIVVRTASASALRRATAGSVVAFQLDSASLLTARPRHAWSVLARGPAALVTDTEDANFLALSRLAPAAGGFRPHFVTLTVTEISGREF